MWPEISNAIPPPSKRPGQLSRTRSYRPGRGQFNQFFHKINSFRPCTLWSINFMVKKLNLDNFWEKILLPFPLTCAAGPEVVLGEPE